MTAVATIVEADLDRREHQEAVLALTSMYALEPTGLGGPLPDSVARNLIPGLRKHPTTLILLAFVGGEPVGLATCFLGFSTFRAMPLLNLHDLAVHPEYRSRGIGRSLLRAVVERARSLGCCRVTLEVNENNHPAKRLYESEGFAASGAGEPVGPALFYVKPLLSPAPKG